jgi:hypothetical protein
MFCTPDQILVLATGLVISTVKPLAVRSTATSQVWRKPKPEKFITPLNVPGSATAEEEKGVETVRPLEVVSVAVMLAPVRLSAFAETPQRIVAATKSDVAMSLQDIVGFSLVVAFEALRRTLMANRNLKKAAFLGVVLGKIAFSMQTNAATVAKNYRAAGYP